ncbi:MAG: dTDP-4-dehydrorhamnose reductase [Hyphomicrobiales bacterium]|nr:dTDP-4-dehydrorhamnose reductase [Hyphomicrobiales bacterium]MBV9054046.1 dTDP-4-dehydrorhamnose reductase [Hyphomicrobiales bacterium]
MDILVTGGTGQVGLELKRHAWPAGVEVHFPGRDELDLSKPDEISRVVASRHWSVVINAAAFTAVDKAETEVAEAWLLNAVAPAVLAAEAAKANIPLVHVSTDYVFSGEKSEPYVEEDRIAPLGVYGASKEGGEQGVRSARVRHAIVRTAWVVSEHRANFLKTMLRLARERDRLSVVADQWGCPTSARDFAGALVRVAIRLASDDSAPTGTFHLVNAGETSWHGFAVEIMRRAFPNGDGPRIEAIQTCAYPTPAKRPANSRLATEKIEKAYGIKLRPWPEAIAEIIAALERKDNLTTSGR